jgi:carbon storage regulator
MLTSGWAAECVRRLLTSHAAKRREAFVMLVLTRKSNQSIMIGDDIEVSVLAIMGEKVRIGIQAPRDVPVFRKEVYLEIQEERSHETKGAREEVDAALRGMGDDAPTAE